MLPTWDDDMATGVPEIDADHRQIAAIFDDVLLSLAKGYGPGALVTELSRLVDAICEHIEREDDLMRAIDYPSFGAHQADHDEYFNRLSQLMVDCQKHNRCVANKARELLTLWKYNHQELHDRPLARAILALREGPPVMRPEFAHPSAYR